MKTYKAIYVRVKVKILEKKADIFHKNFDGQTGRRASNTSRGEKPLWND